MVTTVLIGLSYFNTFALLKAKRFSWILILPRPATLLKKSLWHRCFTMNFAKFLKTSFFHRTPPLTAFELRKVLLVESYRPNRQMCSNEEKNISEEYLNSIEEWFICKEETQLVYSKNLFANLFIVHNFAQSWD